MNPRERFKHIMCYGEVDRIPLWIVEEVTEGVIRQWIREGVFPIGMNISDVFPLDPVRIIRLDTEPLPAFVKRGIGGDKRWNAYIDEYGFTVRILKEQSVSPRIYYYVNGVVKNRQDWEKLKERYNPNDPQRKPRSWSPELFDVYNQATCPVGMRIDYAYFAEDGIAYKHSSLVSPKMYSQLWIPAMRKVTDFLHSHNIKIIGHYSSGDQTPLIPILLDIGVNLYFPLEVAAGMDAIELRKQFGRDILLIGNISRQALMDGPYAVEKEFYAKVP